MVDHPPLRNEILSFYSNELKRLSGFDWSINEKIYHDLGNVTGVYPDVLLLFYWLIKTFNLKNIVELGSGFSTLFFQYMTNKEGLSFISYEQGQKWMDLTNKLLESQNLKADINFLSRNIVGLGTDFDANCMKADLIFIDCLDREYWLTAPVWSYRNAKFIVIDDLNTYANSIFTFMDYTKRHKFFVYNNAGRMDRLEFVSIKEEISPDLVFNELGYL